MGRLLALLLQRRAELLTLLLGVVALGLTVTAETPQRLKFLDSSNQLAGSLFQVKKNFTAYFNLSRANQQLRAENATLREALYQSQFERALLDGKFGNSNELEAYKVTHAMVIKNSVLREKNLITINKGYLDGIQRDMGVVTHQGVVGIVEKSSEHFSTIISLLHKDMSLNAALKNTSYFGSLIWDGSSIDRCTLLDLPRVARLEIGDTIVTGGMSSVFPPGIPIGQVSSYSIPNNSSFYKVEVRLLNDMANLGQVYIVEPRLANEINSLQESTDD